MVRGGCYCSGSVTVDGRLFWEWNGFWLMIYIYICMFRVMGFGEREC